MPAIQLSRLRSQSAQLAARFSQPGAFVSTLHTLLDMYAERTQRPGLGGTPPGLQSYKAPKPVIRQVLSDITLLATAEPERHTHERRLGAVHQRRFQHCRAGAALAGGADQSRR